MKIRLLLAATVVTMAVPAASVLAFSDIQPAAPYAGAADRLQAQNVINGYANGEFKPMQSINRAEFLKMLMLARFGGEVVSLPTTDFQCFTDFTGTQQWYWQYACEAKEKGILTGNPDGTFRGENAVNVAEGLAMAMRAWNTQLPVYFRAPDHWYDPYIDAGNGMNAFGYVSNNPDHPLTRGEVAVLLDLFVNPQTSTSMSDASSQQCLSSDDCSSNQMCSTEQGDCQSTCSPDDDSCIQVCTGFCVSR